MISDLIIYRKTNLSFKELLFAAFLIFLPFSQALTVNIFFPLKLSEVFLVLLLTFEIATGNILKWKLNSRIMIILLLFVLLIIISLIVNIFYHYPYELAQNVARLGPAPDSILKFLYILMALTALFATRYSINLDGRNIRFFFLGGILSCIYTWYLVISGVLKLPVILLPGMDVNSQVYDVGFGDIIRSGTFKEGNYMGFYLMISAILALYYKNARLSVFFFITMLTTFSTTAIFCSLLFFVICLFNKYKKYKLKLLGSLLLISVILVTLVQLSPGIRTLLFNKVFGNEDTVENANDIYSKADRLNTAYVAMQIAANNPVIGVGPANFGLHFSHYNLVVDFEQDVKKIPNNIYVEILSECGSVALLVFLLFLIFVYRYGIKKSYVLGAGLLASFVYFFAFPTFTMLFIWVFLGVVLA